MTDKYGIYSVDLSTIIIISLSIIYCIYFLCMHSLKLFQLLSLIAQHNQHSTLHTAIWGFVFKFGSSGQHFIV